jgi:hypothetical protein
MKEIMAGTKEGKNIIKSIVEVKNDLKMMSLMMQCPK